MKLDAWLKRDHSPAERLAVVEGVCGAIVDAHQRGVVRGGLEPSGIEVESDGSCRLDLDPPTPGSAYAAPESAQGGPPTAKAEIYCAGLICYEALGGQPAGSDPLARKPLQELRPDLSVDLTDAVMACLEADPEWRPADLAYLLALVRGLQQTKAAAAPRTPAKRVSAPPRAILEPATRQRSDDRGPLTRALPLILVAAAMLATGGAWLWFKVLSPTGAAPGAGAPRPRAAASPVPSASPSEPAVSALPPAAPPSAAPVSDAPRPSTPPSAPVPVSSASPRPSPSAGGASVPSAAPPAPATAMPPPAPTPTMPAETAGTTASLPNPEPAAQTPGDAGAEAAVVSGPASIRAIAPFRLRPGAMNVLDIHGANLRADHRARLAVSKKREDAPGFTAARYQLRNSELLLVFLQVDAAVRPGKYAFSLVGSDGGETNAFTVEVAGR